MPGGRSGKMDFWPRFSSLLVTGGGPTFAHLMSVCSSGADPLTWQLNWPLHSESEYCEIDQKEKNNVYSSEAWMQTSVMRGEAERRRLLTGGDEWGARPPG